MEVGLNTVSNVASERMTYEKTGNKKIDDFYSGMSAAAEKSKSHAKGNALALTMLPYSDSMSYGMAAFDSDMSTQEDPIIKISVNYGGEQRYYDVHVNEVDPRNASAVEMFALSAYMDENGMTDQGTFGSYNKMKVYGQNASEFGDFPDLQSMDGYNVRTDWIKMLRQMAEAYLGNPNTYEQSLDANKLADVVERVSEKQTGNLISSITINTTIQHLSQKENVNFSVDNKEKTYANELELYMDLCKDYPNVSFRIDDLNGTNNISSDFSFHQTKDGFSQPGVPSITLDKNLLIKALNDKKFEKSLRGYLKTVVYNYENITRRDLNDPPYCAVDILECDGHFQTGVTRAYSQFSTDEQIRQQAGLTKNLSEEKIKQIINNARQRTMEELFEIRTYNQDKN